MERANVCAWRRYYVEKSTRGKINSFESTHSTHNFSASYLHRYATLTMCLLGQHRYPDLVQPQASLTHPPKRVPIPTVDSSARSSSTKHASSSPSTARANKHQGDHRPHSLQSESQFRPSIHLPGHPTRSVRPRRHHLHAPTSIKVTTDHTHSLWGYHPLGWSTKFRR